jgi:hypothetical protein
MLDTSYSSRTGTLRPLAERKHKGYWHVFVRYGVGRSAKRKEPVHKLVLVAFVGSAPSPAHEGRHLDDNVDHNHRGNLMLGHV